MERLDVYDEYMNFLKSEDRDVVHKKGMWHKTVHCWLYDKKGNIYFQIRKDSNKLYTTASGHVLAGETVKEAFHREVLEEIGVSVDIKNAELVEMNVWKMDKLKNGQMFMDRAFAHVYINPIDVDYARYNFDENEVLGIVKVNAQDCLNLLSRNVEKISASRITQTKTEKAVLTIDDFLVMKDELALIKYGKILQSVIHACTNKNAI